MEQIDFEKIWKENFRFMRDNGDWIKNYGISAMKAAVSAAIPVILDYAAERAQAKVVNNGTIVMVNQQSITSLAEDKDLKMKLGLT